MLNAIALLQRERERDTERERERETETDHGTLRTPSPSKSKSWQTTPSGVGTKAKNPPVGKPANRSAQVMGGVVSLQSFIQVHDTPFDGTEASGPTQVTSELAFDQVVNPSEGIDAEGAAWCIFLFKVRF